MILGYRLQPRDGATDLRYTADWKAHSLPLILMAPLINIMARRNTTVALSKLKELAEAGD